MYRVITNEDHTLKRYFKQANCPSNAILMETVTQNFNFIDTVLIILASK
jgi:hypothetical protein